MKAVVRYFLAVFVQFSLMQFTANAETLRGTLINRLPYVINRPGVYVLARDLTTPIVSGAAVTIQADRVIVDLNSHAIRYNATIAAPTTAAVGISSATAAFVTVRNGIIAKFGTGVELKGSGAGLRVENLTVDGCNGTGILVEGSAPQVRWCSVSNTDRQYAPSFGIRADGSVAMISNCTVTDTTANAGSLGQFATSIEVGAAGAILENNICANAYLAANSVGVFGTSMMLTGNKMVNLGTGFFVSGSKYFNNLTRGCTTSFIPTSNVLVGIND